MVLIKPYIEMTSNDIKFNFDNPKIHLGYVPPYSCGQFIINCLSHSRHIVPCAPTWFVRKLLQDSKSVDLAWKHENMMDFFPSSKPSEGSWHNGTRYYDSNRWTTVSPYWLDDLEEIGEPGELLWTNVNSQMRDYIAQYYRMDARRVSNSDMGFFGKLHTAPEMQGFKSVFPNARIFSIKNYEKTQDILFQKKAYDYATDQVLSWWRQTEKYAPIGYVVDMDIILSGGDHKFSIMMGEMYEYFDLDDYDSVKNFLTGYRTKYIQSSFGFHKESTLR